MSSISGLDASGWDSLFSGSINIPTSLVGGSGPREWSDADIMAVGQRILSGPGPTDPGQVPWFNTARAWMNAGLMPLLFAAASAESDAEAMDILRTTPRAAGLINWLTGVGAAELDDDDDDWLGTAGTMQRNLLRA